MLGWALFAYAQQAPAPPSGQPVFNQALAARLLTPSDTTILTTTRGLYIGDATACNVAVRMVQDSSAVTFTNVPSGTLLPFSVVQVMASNTSCATVVGLY